MGKIPESQKSPSVKTILKAGILCSIVCILVSALPASAIIQPIDMTGLTLGFSRGSNTRLNPTSGTSFPVPTLPYVLPGVNGSLNSYPNAVTSNGQSVDVRVTLTAASGMVDFDWMDDNSTSEAGSADYLFDTRPEFLPTGGAITYRMDFYYAGTTNPVPLENLSIFIGDIDIRQKIEFPGVTSYKMATASPLQVRTNSQDSSVPVGYTRFSELNGTGVATTAPDKENYWVEMNFADPMTSLSFLLAAGNRGSANPAQFQLAFRVAPWSVSTATTVTQTARYNVSYDGNGALGGTVPASTAAAVGNYHEVADNTGTLTNGSNVFAGWNTRSDGSGVTYAAGSSLTPSVDTTLYAIWQPLPTFAMNGPLALTGSIGPALLSAATLLIVTGLTMIFTSRRRAG